MGFVYTQHDQYTYKMTRKYMEDSSVNIDPYSTVIKKYESCVYIYTVYHSLVISSIQGLYEAQ